MSYVPNAADAAEPVGSRFVSSAAPEFRALKARVNALSLGGGGGGSAALGGFTAPDPIVLDQFTPNGRIVVPDTNPMGWNAGSGRMTVQFDVVFNNYFAANPNGHVAIVLRAESAVIATAVRGQGILIGDATGFSFPSNLEPTPMIESWHNGIPAAPGDNTTYPNSDGARSTGGLQDGKTYRFMIDASCTKSLQRYIRYRMWEWNGTRKVWEHRVDTGDVHDANVWADLTNYGLVFGHVFASNLSSWNVTFSPVVCTWGPAEHDVPDQTSKLSRYGAQLQGDLEFLGPAIREVKTASSNIDFRISGTKIASMTVNGIALKDSTVALGTPLVSYTFMSNWGGGAARGFTDGTVLNIDNICAMGYISSVTSNPPTPAQMENNLRPLYCIVSTLIQALKERKVI